MPDTISPIPFVLTAALLGWTILNFVQDRGRPRRPKIDHPMTRVAALLIVPCFVTVICVLATWQGAPYDLGLSIAFCCVPVLWAAPKIWRLFTWPQGQ